MTLNSNPAATFAFSRYSSALRGLLYRWNRSARSRLYCACISGFFANVSCASMEFSTVLSMSAFYIPRCRGVDRSSVTISRALFDFLEYLAYVFV